MTQHCYVIWFRYAKRYLGTNPLPQVPMADTVGWRPLRWTAKLADAEKFGSRTAAELFIRSCGRDMRTVFEEGDDFVIYAVPTIEKPLIAG